eukprot:1302771-Rhodomonas_salina.1
MCAGRRTCAHRDMYARHGCADVRTWFCPCAASASYTSLLGTSSTREGIPARVPGYPGIPTPGENSYVYPGVPGNPGSIPGYPGTRVHVNPAASTCDNTAIRVPWYPGTW